MGGGAEGQQIHLRSVTYSVILNQWSWNQQYWTLTYV